MHVGKFRGRSEVVPFLTRSLPERRGRADRCQRRFGRVAPRVRRLQPALVPRAQRRRRHAPRPSVTDGLSRRVGFSRPFSVRCGRLKPILRDNPGRLADSLREVSIPLQAKTGQGDGGPPLQPRGDLREPGARFQRQPCRGRRPARRRLRIPDAPLRDRVRQEQGPVLHPGGSLPHHGQGDRRREREIGRPDHPRSDLRLRFAAAESPRRSEGAHPPRPRPLRAGDGQRHQGAGPDEHDPARLPHGGNLAGQQPLQPPLQGPRWPPQDV